MIEQIRILLIHDDELALKYLKDQLINNAKYLVSCASIAQTALEIFKENNFDVVLAKFGLPDFDGISLVGELKKIDPDCIVIALGKAENSTLTEDNLRLGIYDYVTEDIPQEKLFLLIKKGAHLHTIASAYYRLNLSLKEQNAALQKQNIALAKRIEDSTRNLTRLYEDLRSTYMFTIKTLAQAIDARDHYTYRHSENVSRYARAIAQELNLSIEDIELVEEACELHDLGKIGIADCILTKPSALSPEEWEQMKQHPQTAAKILEPLTFLGGVVGIIKQHHENYDGSGYPQGLRGEDIHLGARIIRLADTYDAMRSARSYRNPPFSKEETISEIKENSGKQFDPKVVEAFLKIAGKF